MKALYIFAVLIVANFLYQYMDAQLYMVAVERSFFQGWALLAYWAFEKLD